MELITKLEKYYNYNNIKNDADFVNEQIKNFFNYPKHVKLENFDYSNYNLLVKLYIIIYLLKKQFKIILGELDIDYKLYISSKEDWNFKICNDSYVFNDTPIIIIKIINVTHFFTDLAILGNYNTIDKDYEQIYNLIKKIDNDWTISFENNIENEECFLRHLLKKANVKQINETIKSSNFYIRDLEFENTMNTVLFNNIYKNIYIGDKLSLFNKYNFTEDRKYSLEEIIEVCINAKKLLMKYKNYMLNINIDTKDKLTNYRTLLNKYDFYNNTLYCGLKSLFYKINNLDSFYKKELTLFNSRYIIIPNLSNVPLQSYFKTCTLNQINNVEMIELEKVMSKMTLSEGFTQVFNKSKNDIDIYMELQDKLKSSKENIDRGSIRVNQTRELLNNFQNKNIKYLDFGGSDGTITSALTKYMRINKENSYSVDIENWFNISNIEKFNNITYVRVKEDNILTFEDNSIDFITCFQTLHHIKNNKFIINEFKRILKPGGIILIREHDCNNDKERMLIDIEHSVNEIVQRHLDQCNSEKYLNDYEAYYQNRNYWKELFIQTGFSVKYNYKFTNLIKGPTRYYYEVFEKL